MVSILTSQNFSVMAGKNSKVLKISVPGNVLVFFKSTVCPGCNEVEPIFMALAAKDHRVSYCIVNLDDYRDLILMARETSTPIQAVPMLMLYCNQFPKAKFTGAKNLVSIQSFLTKALQSTVASSNGPVSQTAAMTPMSTPTQFMQPQGNLPPQVGPGMSGYYMPNGAAAPPQGRVYQPDFASGGGPSINMPRGQSRGVNQLQHSMNAAQLGGVEDEDDSNLLMPGTVIPHNTPWEVDHRK